MTFFDFDFSRPIEQRFFGDEIFDARDFFEWRFCYAGGRLFREEFLQRFDDRENEAEYIRRRSLTPIPAYAKTAINNVKNSVIRRLPDIRRSGGTKKWQDAVAGVGRGVDRRGSSMNAFIAKKILAELLVMGRTGVLVDAPALPDGMTQDEVPESFSPWLNSYRVEFIHNLVPADVDSPSDWSSVKLENNRRQIDPVTGENVVVSGFRKYWLDADRDNKVNLQDFNESDEATGEIRHLNIDAIPLVLFSIDQSLMADACSYQISFLNLISAATSYSIDSSYSFLTRQRGGDDAGEWLIGEEEDTETGRNKGLFYPKGMDRPGYISPDSAPVLTSLEQQREMKKTIEDLVLGAISEIGEGSVEAGLASIGMCVQIGESRLWDHYTTFEARDAARRRMPIVDYPDTWSMKSDEERLKEGIEFLNLGNLLIGQDAKKQAQFDAADRFWRGKISTEDLNKIKKTMADAPYSIADPDVVIKAKKEGIFTTETTALALGANPGEGKAATEEGAAKAVMVAAAMSDASNPRGAPSLLADNNSNRTARDAEANTSHELGNPGTRGEE